jgi:hypothetical protein
MAATGSPATNPWTKINRTEDAEPFSGQFVKFCDDTGYYNDFLKPYVFSTEKVIFIDLFNRTKEFNKIYFGYLTKRSYEGFSGGIKAYRLFTLLKTSDGATSCYVKCIGSPDLYMKRATPEEFFKAWRVLGKEAHWAKSSFGLVDDELVSQGVS